ncbi:hypothetical protein SLEP1_g28998 [Rubroshorea leprosula]|uniref:non-specific serine/threonine protein kinase n=1 Tax=Rubroshorea leprosula TaxID=152421 RepID=A0AAV5JVI3_9ROSI|nr:hypothetical protein SLEP1_g28998 [Rubroshorea leprosula]
MNFSGTLSPRIGILKTLTTLTLKGSGITGEILEEFGNLSSLTSLDLENNHLSGEIPPSLGKLQKLQFLNCLEAFPYCGPLMVTAIQKELKPGEAILDWPTRKRIALGAARVRGLEYLHEHCNPKSIHQDVRAANVLLDEDFEAVVGDFGLAK